MTARRFAALTTSVALPTMILVAGLAAPSGAAAVSLASPPIDGTNCYYANTWAAPRSGGRTHEGVDIIANSGTPLYAPLSGRVVRSQGSLAGNQAKVVAPDGTYFIFAHLSAYDDSAPHGANVAAGAVIGYVGKTGNTTVNHLHFEVHPQGGGAVDPTPVVAAVNTCGAKVADDAMKRPSPWAGNATTAPATTSPKESTTSKAPATTRPATTTTTRPPSTIASIGGTNNTSMTSETDPPSADVGIDSPISGSRGRSSATTAAPTTTAAPSPATTTPTGSTAPTSASPTTPTTAPTGSSTTNAPLTGAITYSPPAVALTSASMAANRTIGVTVVGFPGIPSNASLVDLTVTLTGTGSGAAAIWPCGQSAGLPGGTPLTAVESGTATSTRVSLAPGDGGRVCLVSATSATVRVEVNGVS